MTWNLTVTFEMNGKGYRTDQDTLDVLRTIVPTAKDGSAVQAVMELGQMAGRIVQIANQV